MNKVIFHIDLDSYFVSAQRTVQPDLIGKPVAITTGERRSIISAASYEAKKLGVYVPMPFYKAKELVPDLIPIKPNFGLYTLLSTKLFELLSDKITKNIEVASIDECYMDVTTIWKKYGSPFELAKHIQQLILKELKLPVSIGISSNKFVAKMSTQVNKPFGITITKPGSFIKKFGDWDVQKIHGIGAPTAHKLRLNKIRTIKDLSETSKEDIDDILGAIGWSLVQNVNENGPDEIDISMNELKGIGNSITFMDRDRHIRKEILEIIKVLCESVSIRLNNRNMAGKVLRVVYKPRGGLEVKARSRQLTLPRPISTVQEIFHYATIIFDELWKEESVKFAGVSISKLSDIFENTYQQSIFDEKIKKSKVEDLMYKLNAKLGHKTLISLREASENIKKTQNQSRFLEADRLVKRRNK